MQAVATGGDASSPGVDSPPAAPLLSVQAVRKRFGPIEVLRGVSVDVVEGEFLTILGESGSGKTTLLRLIAGFEQPDEGQIWMRSERLDGLPPFRRRVNTVFQQYALFPHLSVADNVAYGLRIARVPKPEIAARVEQALAMVKMTPQASKYPAKISGGQQQRVALARALVNRPRLLLLDEPLAALDANLRAQMQEELKSLQRTVGITFIFVTHDQAEAMAISDRVAILRSGRLEQLAPPRDIYYQPASVYVATFVGRTNLLRCDVRGGVASCHALSFGCGRADGPAVFSLRPEAIRAAEAGGERRTVRFKAIVGGRTFQGPTELLTLEGPGGLTLLARVPGQSQAAGEREFEFFAHDAVFVESDAL
jgi:ABC-type Fe3+/spermidine/putrescine transport system ATPase subunit